MDETTVSLLHSERFENHLVAERRITDCPLTAALGPSRQFSSLNILSATVRKADTTKLTPPK